MAAPIVRVFWGSPFLKEVNSLLAKSVSCPAYNYVPVMCANTKPYSPQFRQKRREKRIYFDKQEIFRTQQENKTTEYLLGAKKEEKKKRDHIEEFPERIVNRIPFSTMETGGIHDSYVPPEGDGKSSLLSTEGVFDRVDQTKKAALRWYKHIRVIKQHEDNFSLKALAPELLDIYVEANKLLPKYRDNMSRFYQLVTGHCSETMTHDIDRMTIEWEYLGSVEPPKVVHVQCAEAVMKGIYFAQLTLRAHTKQKLAIYDQFGRLMYGHRDLEQNVLEYLVFEKNIVDTYGRWRLHGKIIPDWQKTTAEMHRSLRLDDESVGTDIEESKKETAVKG